MRCPCAISFKMDTHKFLIHEKDLMKIAKCCGLFQSIEEVRVRDWFQVVEIDCSVHPN